MITTEMRDVAMTCVRTQRVRSVPCCDSSAASRVDGFAIHVVLRVAFRAFCVMRITAEAAGPVVEGCARWMRQRR